MGAYRVTPQELHNTANQVNSGAENIAGENNVLRSRVSQLRDNWDGQAQQNFDQLFENWRRGAEQMNEALRAMASFLNNAGTTYQQTEDSISGAARG